MNKGLTLLTNMYANLDITDMETCYKLFKREVIQEIAPKLRDLPKLTETESERFELAR